MLQLRVRERCSPQVPHDSVAVSSSPGLQPLAPEHAPQSPQLPQPQLASQVRVRASDPLPQFPHGWVEVSVASGAQPVSPVQLPQSPQSSQPQAPVHIRTRVCSPELQLPHS